LKAWPVLGIALIQTFLLSAHWFLFFTWIAFCGDPGPVAGEVLRVSLLVLGFSFVAAALLGFYFSNWIVRATYRAAAVWLGFLNFFFWANCASWLVWEVLALSRMDPNAAKHRAAIAWAFMVVAILVGVWGMINARWVRVRRVPIRLANLPPSWRGRRAMMVSDLHLGHVNGAGFSQRIANFAAGLKPDILFISGDFFDGTKTDPERMAAPFNQISPPLGMFFATGNHDEFGDTRHFLAALAGAGIRVLTNEKAIVDGMQIVGVPYHDTTYPMRMRANLEGLGIDRSVASILLNHVPNRLPIVEEAGISLQLSGHTHGGQFFPFNWLTRRVFGKSTYGLNSFGALQVYTSYGAGTWGPPMRVGTRAEVVLLTFE
jgi:uncharacterized protein